MDKKLKNDNKFYILTWWLSIIFISVIILLGSLFVSRSYVNKLKRDSKNYRPPYLGRLETDLEAVNRDGQKVFLSNLKGKIYVVGYQYTECPSGCLATAAYMKELREKFSSKKNFHLVSISVNPKGDTLDKINNWMKVSKIDFPNWWFLTGEPDRISKYMSSEFKLYPVKENKDPKVIATEGEFSHDLRLVIVDNKANIRGYYDVMNSQIGESEYKRLIKDLNIIFK